MGVRYDDQREPFTYLIAWDAYVAKDNSDNKLVATEINKALLAMEHKPRDYQVYVMSTELLSTFLEKCIRQNIAYACFIVTGSFNKRETDIVIQLNDSDQHRIIVNALSLDSLLSSAEFVDLCIRLQDASITGYTAAKFKP